MKKLVFLLVLFLEVPLFGQTRSDSRFIISEKFSSAQEAVDYANALPLTQKVSVQFITESEVRSSIPATYRVVVDNLSWLNESHPIVGVDNWDFMDRLDIDQSAEFVNSLNGRYSVEVNIRAQFLGYWNPNLNPYSTTVTVFFIPALVGGNCHYEVVDIDLGAPKEALKHSKTLEGVNRVEFVTQFNVGSSVFGSLWLLTSKCVYPGPDVRTWRLLENDKEGNTFDIESAVSYVEKEKFRFVRFVSFVSPSQHDSRSRILIFYQN